MRKAKIEIIEATEPLLCGSITFRVLRPDSRGVHTPHGVWRIIVGPHGDTREVAERADQLGTAESHTTHGRLESWLPEGWEYTEFLTAWSYYARGHRVGYALGLADSCNAVLAAREVPKTAGASDIWAGAWFLAQMAGLGEYVDLAHRTDAEAPPWAAAIRPEHSGKALLGALDMLIGAEELTSYAEYWDETNPPPLGWEDAPRALWQGAWGWAS